MAIGTPVGIASLAVSGASASTITATTTASVAAGDSIVVAFYIARPSTTLTSVTDSVGNTYAVDVTKQYAGQQHYCALASCHNATALASGGTITATYSAATTSLRNILAATVSGLVSSSALDQTATKEAASGVSWTVGPTGTLAQADEIVFVSANDRTQGTANTPGTGWADVYDLDHGGSIRSVLTYKTVSSTAAVTADGSMGSGLFVASLATYKAVPTTTVTATTASATASGDNVVPTFSATVAAATASATAAGDTVVVSAGSPVTVTASSASATASGGSVTPTFSVTITVDGASATAAGDTATVVIVEPVSITGGLEFHVTGLWKPGETSVPYYGRVSDPQAGEVVIPLNDSRTATVTMSTHDEVVQTLAALPQVPYAIHLKVYYNGILVFWGPAKVRAGDFGASTVRLDAVDLSLRLIRHMIREGDLLLGDGQVDATTGEGFLPISHEGLRLLRDAGQTETFPTLGIIDGDNDFTADPDAIIGVRRGDQIWNTWIQLCQTLGPDFELQPIDGTDQAYAQLNTFASQGDDVSSAVQMHYGVGRSNLDGLSFVEGEEYVNLAHVLDKDNKLRRTVTNATALTRTGPYIHWDTTDFDVTHSDIADAQEVLDEHGAGIIDAYSVPLIALSLTLPVDTPDGFHYLADYGVGDTIGVAGRDGFLELPEAPYRITRVTLAVDGEAVRPSLEVVADRVADDTIDGSNP